jgi:hypothetical protein
MVVPPFSSKPQRPSRPVPTVIGPVIPDWIWPPVRGVFHTRASSTTPWKKPAATPVLFMAVPMAACWMLVASGLKSPPSESERSSRPSRYRRQVSVDVSYTAAAWCQTLLVTAAVPVTGWLTPLALSSKSATSRPVAVSMPRK